MLKVPRETGCLHPRHRFVRSTRLQQCSFGERFDRRVDARIHTRDLLRCASMSSRDEIFRTRISAACPFAERESSSSIAAAVGQI